VLNILVDLNDLAEGSFLAKDFSCIGSRTIQRYLPSFKAVSREGTSRKGKRTGVGLKKKDCAWRYADVVSHDERNEVSVSTIPRGSYVVLETRPVQPLNSSPRGNPFNRARRDRGPGF